MRQLLCSAALSAWLASAPSTAAQPTAAKPLDEPEAYAVYAALLPNQWPVRRAKASVLLFQQETSTYPRCMPSGPPLDTEWKPVVDSYRTQNEPGRLLQPGFPLGIPYMVVPRAEIKATFGTVPNDPQFGWSGFYAHYPNSAGYMVASVPGFDAERRRAMVYMAHSCSPVCGGGTYHFLEKSEGSWREVQLAGITTCAWYS